MNIRLSAQFYRLLHQVIIGSVLITLVIAGTDLRIIGLGPRTLFVGIAFLAFLTIGLSCMRRPHNAQLLISQADYAWIVLIALTALTVVLAPFPRRSLEIWVLTTGLQLPLAYVTLFLLRRGWREQAVFRGLLVVGGYIFAVGTLTSLAYVIQVLNARISGVYVPPFRLYAVLDNPSILAMFIAVTVPCIIGYFLNGVRRVEGLLLVLWLFGAVITTVASATRSGAIALLIGVAVSLMLGLRVHPRQPLRRLHLWAAAHRPQAILLAAVVGIFAVVVLVGMFYVMSAAPGHSEASHRLEHYSTALLTFMQHPLAGQGPGSFIMAEAQHYSIPPYLFVPHPHNMVMTSATEGGLLGLSALAAFGLGTAYVCALAWRTQPKRRPLLAGAIGGLVGFFASGLLESPMSQPGLFLLAGILLMLVASGLPAPRRHVRLRIALLLLLMTVVVLLAVWLLVLYGAYWQVNFLNPPSMTENANAARAGAEELDGLTITDPSDPLLRLQAAYAWANAARLNTDPATTAPILNTALERLEHAITYDPYLGMHYLNLSALYAKANRQEDALRMARRAAEISARDPVAWLNLGMRLEASNDLQDALAAYIRALGLSVRWSYAGFWQVSELRQTVLAEFNADPVSTSLHYDNSVLAGDAARADGRIDDAIRLYREVYVTDSYHPRQVLLDGLIAWAKRDYDAARRLLLDATNLSSDDFVSVDAWSYLGSLALERGAEADMIYAYSRLYVLITSRGIQGFETANNILYSTVSFRRFGLVSDYVPEVTLLDITPTYAKGLKSLAQAKSAANDVSGAARIYSAILSANPLDDEARSDLLALGMPQG